MAPRRVAHIHSISTRVYNSGWLASKHAQRTRFCLVMVMVMVMVIFLALVRSHQSTSPVASVGARKQG